MNDSIQPPPQDKTRYVVHIVGPEDVIPMPDRATAYRVAHQINAYQLDLSDDDLNNSPIFWALVEPIRGNEVRLR